MTITYYNYDKRAEYWLEEQKYIVYSSKPKGRLYLDYEGFFCSMETS